MTQTGLLMEGEYYKERPLRVMTTLSSRASYPIAHSKMGPFPLHQLLELRERKLAVGIENVPNGTRHLAYVFLDGNSHPRYII